MDLPVVTALAAVGILIGLAGIVVPVLPGLILVLGSVLLWALVAHDPVGWGVLAAAAAIAALGWTLQYLIPGRRLRDAGVPQRTLVAGAVGGVLGVFLIPGVGLLVGFVSGVFLAELVRQRTVAAAWPSVRRALVAAATSFGIELSAGTLIATVWAVGAWRLLG
ncbi:MAG: DUF456 domain-containing protein [Austwickia sp.]|nr:MAG: DUF456 domain-containing protein [Austwickia sp.]